MVDRLIDKETKDMLTDIEKRIQKIELREQATTNGTIQNINLYSNTRPVWTVG